MSAASRCRCRRRHRCGRCIQGAVSKVRGACSARRVHGWCRVAGAGACRGDEGSKQVQVQAQAQVARCMQGAQGAWSVQGCRCLCVKG